MKTHSDITHLLNKLIRNEHDYYHKVVYPLLDILGVPEVFRWPQFPIKNPFGRKDLSADYLLNVQDVPMVIVEAKPSSEAFADGLRQARNYARNFETKIDEIRDMNVPFLLVAAGNEISMFRAVARAYREFVSKAFTGESRSLPIRWGKRVRYINTARYFTPTEIIQQMVRLCNIQPTDKVIDFTCGSGGFLAETSMSVPDEIAGDFLVNNVVGVDIDPFCVETARTLLGFLFPDRANEVKVFLHNGLYAKPHYKRYSEDKRVESYLAEGQYDVVIGNPPGNRTYSGGNERRVLKMWEERYGTIPHPWDHVFFIRRAIELAKSDGRICLIVPDGFLANSQFQDLRDEILRQCELRAIISLPRVFKNNNAKMAILYMAKNPRWHPSWQVMMASVPARTEHPSENGRVEWEPTNILAELEGIGELFEVVTTENAELLACNG